MFAVLKLLQQGETEVSFVFIVIAVLRPIRIVCKYGPLYGPYLWPIRMGAFLTPVYMAHIYGSAYWPLVHEIVSMVYSVAIG